MNTRDKLFTVRVSQEELEDLHALAKDYGVPTSEFIRQAVFYLIDKKPTLTVKHKLAPREEER